jgi:uncharacterized protein (DUF2336 family)
MPLLSTDLEQISATMDGASQTARDSVLFGLADRLCTPKGRLSAEQARTYDEVVCWLSRHRDAKTRSALATRVARVKQGPVATVRSLAFDPYPEVACPVLRESVLLKDSDLIDIATVESEAHLCAIAARSPVSEPVTDVVVRRGSWAILRTVAANNTAALSSSSVRRLARAAYADGAITVGLLKRKDIPAPLSAKLRVHCQALAKTDQRDRRGEDSGISLDQLKMTTHEMPLAGEIPRVSLPADLSLGEARIEALAQHGILTGRDVGWCLDHGRWTDALVLIARLGDLTSEFVIRAFACPEPDYTLIIMRAADLSWHMAQQVLLHRAGGLDPDGAIARQSNAYAELSRQSAQRALEILRSREHT